jgi:hypothetical protein
MRSNSPLIVLATVSLFAITACTTSPDPSPDPQTSASTAPCIPDASDIAWQPATDTGLQLIGVSEFAIAADGTTTRTDTVLDHEAKLINANPNIVAEYHSQDRNDLFDALIQDVRRTGQVPENFGHPIDPFASSDFDPTPDEGRYFVGFEVMTTQVPFEANCGGGPIEGSLHGLLPGARTTTLIQCGYAPETPSPVDPQLRSYC